MTLSKVKIIGITFFSFAILTSASYAQEGSVIINQDEDIERLLALKKEINTDESSSERYKIQIYSGKRTGGEKIQTEYNADFDLWKSKLVYETPNYKVWVGSFRTRLEADRVLLKVKSKFPSAFIFKPKKK